MEPLNGSEAISSAQLRQQVSAYLAAAHVPAERRVTLADHIVAELPQGLDGPHRWRAVQQLTDRALAQDEGLGEIEDHRILARARLGYVFAPEGARRPAVTSEDAATSSRSEADTLTLPRTVPQRMRPQRLRFWRPNAARTLRHWLQAGSRLKREA